MTNIYFNALHEKIFVLKKEGGNESKAPDIRLTDLLSPIAQ
jgi:hypothetical protein